MATTLSASATCATAALLPTVQVKSSAGGNASISPLLHSLKSATWSRSSPCKYRRQATVAASAGSRNVTEVVEAKNCSVVAQPQTDAASVLAGAMFAFLSETGSAAAAQEVAQIADADARPAVLAVLLAAAVGWVLFNIGGPALSQLQRMQGAGGVGGGKKRAFAGAMLGAGAASLLAAPASDAAVQEMYQVALDQRPLILLLPVAAAAGWVLFNIAVPALNQVQRMIGTQQKGRGRK